MDDAATILLERAMAGDAGSDLDAAPNIGAADDDRTNGSCPLIAPPAAPAPTIRFVVVVVVAPDDTTAAAPAAPDFVVVDVIVVVS